MYVLRSQESLQNDGDDEVMKECTETPLKAGKDGERAKIGQMSVNMSK